MDELPREGERGIVGEEIVHAQGRHRVVRNELTKVTGSVVQCCQRESEM